MENYKKLHARAEMDYISAFIMQWLAFNAWYTKIYGKEGRRTADKSLIAKICKDTSRTNKIYETFRNMMNRKDDNIADEFRANVEHFSFSLQRGDHAFHFGEYFVREHRFSPLFLDDNPDLMIARMANYFFTERIAAESPWHQDFSVFINALYQFRCMIFHGNFEPTRENKDAAKYAYFILRELMREFSEEEESDPPSDAETPANGD